ncbi:MAG TPA: MATE family efflux transporter [Polyangiaceae bacterium]|nr:MATE family efflux transporter [Polyangiaceae bacterium]
MSLSEAGHPQRILSGPLGGEIARFGVPLALGMGLQTAFNLVDAYLIGQLGPGVAGPALGAIGICDQLAALGTIISYGLTVATGALLSRRAGRADHEGVRRVVWQSLLLVSLLSVIFGGLGLLGASWLMGDVVGAKGEVLTLGIPYLRVMMAGSFSIFLLLHLTSVLRALGSSKTPVLLLVLANALNLVLAVVFVYGPGPAPAAFGWGPVVAEALGVPRMGLQGAAWATLLARALALLPLAIILVRRLKLLERPALRPDWLILGEIGRLGWPSSAQLVVRIVAMLFTHALVARMFTSESDQSATTALGIVFRLETMALFIGLGWGSAAQTFVGQNLGVGNAARAKSSGWYAAGFNALMMALLALLYRAYGDTIVGFFDADPRVVAAALAYFKWVGLSYIALGVGIVLGSAIQGAGATLLALLLDAAVVLLFQLPLSLLVVLLPQAQVVHLWQVVALTYFTFALVHVWSYRRGRFLRAQVA